MHILTLQGSPRRRGNTAAVLSCFEEHIAASSHSFEHLELSRYTVNGCLGCGTCQKNYDEPGCRQKDDALAVLARLRAAELIVYATPLYCWDFSSQLKCLMDRHYCLVKWDLPRHTPPGARSSGGRSLLAGRRAALLVTCGDPVENNADVIQTIFRRQMDAVEVAVAGIYILPNCPSERGQLGERPAALAQVMAKELLG